MICWPFYGAGPTTSLRHYFDRLTQHGSAGHSIDHRNLEVFTTVASRAARAAIQANRVTIAIRNEALPDGKSRKTTKSPTAASETTAIGRQLGSPRTARAIVSGASTLIPMINKNAMPCGSGIRTTSSS